MNMSLRILFSVTSILYCLYVLMDHRLVAASIIIALVNIAVVRNHRFVVKLPFMKIGLDVKGALIPLASSILIFIPALLRQCFEFFALLASLAIALSSLNTIMMERLFAVNVMSYTILYYIASYILCGNNTLYLYTLPLAIQIGIVIGSDMLHYIYIKRYSTNTVLVIGGAEECDAIYLSTILVQWLEILRHIIITLIFSVRLM
uniref:DUF1614 domain-containing protein n=1 Tax=Ignisphaera aggregans TaxID=334771 RepID=A0A7J2U3E8_9CREN